MYFVESEKERLALEEFKENLEKTLDQASLKTQDIKLRESYQIWMDWFEEGHDPIC